MHIITLTGQHWARRQILARDAGMSRLHNTRDDRGEGVISMAIAVLIIAFLGVALWAVFKNVIDDAGSTTEDQVGKIGKP